MRTCSGQLTSIGGASDCLSFSEAMLVWVEKDDAPCVFSVYANDELMDDRVASATLPGRRLLEMARQGMEYFNLHLELEGYRWKQQFRKKQPFLAMRIQEITPVSARWQTSNTKNSA